MAALSLVNHTWIVGVAKTWTTNAFALTAGNHVFVFVSGSSTSFPNSVPTAISVTDTAGNTYTRVAPMRQVSTNNLWGAWYACQNAIGNASNTVTATVTATTSPNLSVQVLQLTGGPISGITESFATGLHPYSSSIGGPYSNGAGAFMALGMQCNYYDNGPSVVHEGYPSASAAWTNNKAGFSNYISRVMYLARPSGDYNLGRATYTTTPYLDGDPTYYTRMFVLLQIEAGGAVPVVDSGMSKLAGYAVVGGAPNAASVAKMGGYAVLGGAPNAASLSKLTGYAVLYTPPGVVLAQVAAEALRRGAPNLRIGQSAVEVMRRNIGTSAVLSQSAVEVLRVSTVPVSTTPTKLLQSTVEVTRAGAPQAVLGQLVAEVLRKKPRPTVINDRDKLLQATDPRYGAGNSSAILLTSSSQTITNGVPASVNFSVTRLNVPGGTASFTNANGTPMTISGDTATITAADLTASSETVTVTITDGGATYTAIASVAKVTSGSNGTPGARGAGWYYATGNAWADAVAASACPGGPVEADMVTISNGTTFALSKRYSGGSWIVPGTLLTGDLFVTGSIGAAAINTNNLTIRDTNGTILFGAGVKLDGTYIQNLSASQITSGTLSISAAGGGTLLSAGFLGTVVGYRQLAGYNIDANALADPSAPAIKGRGYGNVGVHGENTQGLAGNDGLRGQAATAQNGAGVITSGVVGAQSGYDFYADGAGVNYGPFTGSHDALFAPGDEVEPGDIVIDVECLARNGWSNTLFRVVRSTLPNQPAALGVLATVPRPLSATVPAVFTEHQAGVADEGPSPIGQIVTTVDPLYQELVDAGYSVAGVNALGEGQVNVVGEGGDIAPGDLLVTSSTPGKAMKQSDGLVRNITVAKARESATFNAGEVKTIACIYLAG